MPNTTSSFGPHILKPLPFDPKSLRGLSERLVTSHWENNYGGAVKRLNAIEKKLAELDWTTAPVFTVNGLKREELIAMNSVVLHEVYFESLGASEPGTAFKAQVDQDFGGLDEWAAQFVAMGKALAGGSGWVLLCWNPNDGKLLNTWAADHTHNLAGATPVLALDMYEHSYHMDFGAQAGAYVDAVMKNLNLTTASAKLETLKGQ